MAPAPRDSRPVGVVVRVLGVVQLLDSSGEPQALTTAEGRVLAALTAAADDGATTYQLERAVWDAAPPRSARQSLHNHIHRLRAKLVGTTLVLDSDRYRLEPRPLTDASIVERLVTDAAQALRDGAAPDAVDLLRDARAWWRGEPYAGSTTVPGVLAAQQHLLRLRVLADDGLVQALLASGRYAEAVTELEELLADDPADEARWGLLVEALHRSGRREKGLEAFARARARLVAGLGVEPGEHLQRLHQLLLHGSSTRPALPTDLGPVGRQEVIRDVLSTLHRHGTVVVHGEGGIGKSAVLRGVADQWPGEVVEVQCGGGQIAALGPVAALIDRLRPRLVAAGLPTSLTQIATQLHPGATGSQDSPGALVHRAADVVGRALRSDATTLLVIDDADQGGPTTRSVLREVVDGTGLPVLVAVRDAAGELPLRPGHLEVHLAGLDAAGSAELASVVLQTRVGDRFGQWLWADTAGHPLLMLAVLSDLLAQGQVTLGGGSPRPPSATPVPAQIRELLQQRIARLGSRTRRAVDVVAVVGQPVSPAALAGLLQVEDLEPAVADGTLVRDGDAVRFPHELFRKVAYDYVPPGRRSELHHAVAGLADSGAHRATHLLAAFDVDPEAALQAAVLAGREAVSAHAYAEGWQWLDRALDAGRERLDDLARLTLRVEAADARRLAGLEGHAEPLLEAAEDSLRLGGTDLRRRAVLATLRLGGGVEAGDVQQRVAQLAERALAEESDPAWWARIAAAASLVHSIAGTPERCRELLLAAWSAAADRDEVLVDVLPYAYMGLSHPDDLQERSRACVRLAEAASRMRDPTAEFEAGHLAFSTALQCADGHGARRAHRAMSRLTDRVADAGRRWSLAYQQAGLAALDGRLEQAESLAGVALQVGNGVAPKRAFGAYAGQIFELRRQQGRLTELVEIILQLVADQPEIPGWAAVGSLALAEVDVERSRELFDSAAADDLRGIPRDFAWLAAVVSLGRTAVVLGDADRAAPIEAALLPYGQLVCWQGTCSWGPVAEVLAGLADLRGDSAGRRRHEQVAAARHAGLRSGAASGP